MDAEAFALRDPHGNPSGALELVETVGLADFLLGRYGDEQVLRRDDADLVALAHTEERRALLAEHGRMARGYPDVRANTVASFALGDYEWTLAFEADELHRIVDLMRDLRAAGARRHVRPPPTRWRRPSPPIPAAVRRTSRPTAASEAGQVGGGDFEFRSENARQGLSGRAFSQLRDPRVLTPVVDGSRGWRTVVQRRAGLPR